jgi:hypothetical protein
MKEKENHIVKIINCNYKLVHKLNKLEFLFMKHGENVLDVL